MTTPPPVQGAPLPAAFQAPPTDPHTPPPGYAYPPPAAAVPVFQQPPAPAPGPAAQPVPEPLSAVASAALRAEAAPPGQAAQVVTVTYGGQAYTVPAERDRWPLDVLEALEDNQLVKALRGLLGPQQWARFKATGPLTGDLGRLWEAVGKAAGFDSLGE